jgi:hypothetical protein
MKTCNKLFLSRKTLISEHLSDLIYEYISKNNLKYLGLYFNLYPSNGISTLYTKEERGTLIFNFLNNLIENNLINTLKTLEIGINISNSGVILEKLKPFTNLEKLYLNNLKIDNHIC